MHCYHHALASQRQHGGALDDYLPLHNWFDASKSTLAYFTYRMLNHHREGIREAVHRFGAAIVNADGAAVPVETLALQHLTEDMSIIPMAADWLRHLELPANGRPLGSRPSPRPPIDWPPTAPDCFAPPPRPCSRCTAGFLRPRAGSPTGVISRCVTTASAFSRPSNISAPCSAIKAPALFPRALPPNGTCAPLSAAFLPRPMFSAALKASPGWRRPRKRSAVVSADPVSNCPAARRDRSRSNRRFARPLPKSERRAGKG